MRIGKKRAGVTTIIRFLTAKMPQMENDSSNSITSSAWTVLYYEVEMFLGTRHLIKNLTCGDLQTARLLNNALLECSLLHTRILADIFLSRNRNRYPDDISLDDLGIEIDGRCKNLVNSLEEAYGNGKTKNSKCWIINKMLAHPSNYRSDKFNYAEVFEALDGPIIALIKEIFSLSDRIIPFNLPETKD